jgi:Rps23 Pro-64 3,4-dihydroxylase Tpa1-like proline 4-hydroxylase
MHYLKASQANNPFIWIKDNVLTEEFCKKIIQKFESDEKKSSGVANKGLHLDVKQSTDLYISQYNDWKTEDNVFLESLNENYMLYQNYLDEIFSYMKMGNVDVFCNFSDIIDFGYQIQRTEKGQFYTWHHDGAYCEEYFRSLTYIWYLNDDFTGGETEFYDGTIIKPSTGKLMFFPATWTYLHQGRKVISGTKYICTGWMAFRPN